MSFSVYASNLCWSQEGISFIALRDNLGSLVTLWDLWKDYRSTDWPVLWDGIVVKCEGNMSSFFPVNEGGRLWCVLEPSISNVCMDWILGKAVE